MLISLWRRKMRELFLQNVTILKAIAIIFPSASNKKPAVLSMVNDKSPSVQTPTLGSPKVCQRFSYVKTIPPNVSNQHRAEIHVGSLFKLQCKWPVEEHMISLSANAQMKALEYETRILVECSYHIHMWAFFP